MIGEGGDGLGRDQTISCKTQNAPVDLGDEVEVEPLALRLRADDAAGVQRAAHGLEELGREERLGGACVQIER